MLFVPGELSSTLCSASAPSSLNRTGAFVIWVFPPAVTHPKYAYSRLALLFLVTLTVWVPVGTPDPRKYNFANPGSDTVSVAVALATAGILGPLTKSTLVASTVALDKPITHTNTPCDVPISVAAKSKDASDADAVAATV